MASLSPSTGAVPGGTLVTVNGTAFDAGGAYRCGFGAAGVSEATRVDDATLRCVSPAAPEAGLQPLEVSLNARDFTIDAVGFLYYELVDLTRDDSLLPANGPFAGGTTVAVRGGDVSLRGGSHYRCRFGEVVVPATYVADAPTATLDLGRHEQGRPAYVGPHPNARLLPPRTWRLDADHPNSGIDAVLCVAPPRAAVADGAGTLLVAFAVSLNGRDFSNASSGFTYYEEPTLIGMAPLTGPRLEARRSPRSCPRPTPCSCAPRRAASATPPLGRPTRLI